MSLVLHLSLHFTHTPQHTHAFQRISIRVQFVPYLLINGNLALSQNLIHPVTQTHRSQKSQYSYGTSCTCSGIKIRWTLVKHTTHSMPDWLLLCEIAAPELPVCTGSISSSARNVKYFNSKNKNLNQSKDMYHIFFIKTLKPWSREATHVQHTVLTRRNLVKTVSVRFLRV